MTPSSWLMNRYWYSARNKVPTLFRFPLLFPNVLLLCQDPCQDVTSHRVDSSPYEFFWLWQFSGFPCFFFMTLTVLRSTGQRRSRMSLNFICRMRFSWLDWAMSLGKENHKGKMLPSSHHIKETSLQYDVTIDVDLDLGLGSYWPGRSTRKLALPLLSILCSLEGSC